MEKSLFQPQIVSNNAGGNAFKLTAQQELAQFAVTSYFGNTFYCSAESQLTRFQQLLSQVDKEFVAKTAIYARKIGMKDVPAVCAAYLACTDTDLFGQVAGKIIDDLKTFRNVLHIIRSGTFGRKSFGTKVKRILNAQLERFTSEQIFRGSIGGPVSVADAIKMLHPVPSSKDREVMYGYLIGKSFNSELLPQNVQEFERFKKEMGEKVPNVPFRKLTALPLKPDHWKQIAKHMSWTETRMNLETLIRHGVSEDPEMVQKIAQRLSDPEQIKKSRVFPYQLMAAKWNTSQLPFAWDMALGSAMESAVENIPGLNRELAILVDVSGSMKWKFQTETHKSAMSRMNVAALFAVALYRKNPGCRIVPFDDKVYADFIPEGTIFDSAKVLSRMGGGGTNCGLPLARLNTEQAKYSVVLYISDNESWGSNPKHATTGTVQQWQMYKQRNPQAKMICLDLTPNNTIQASTSLDVLNCGGFADSIFTVIEAFINQSEQNHWVKMIEAVEI